MESPATHPWVPPTPPEPNLILNIPLPTPVFDHTDWVIKPIWHWPRHDGSQRPGPTPRDVWTSATRRGSCSVERCQQALHRGHPTPGLIRSPVSQNAGCQACAPRGRRTPGEPLCCSAPTFRLDAHDQNASGGARHDALCHSIKQNAFLPSRHVKGGGLELGRGQQGGSTWPWIPARRIERKSRLEIKKKIEGKEKKWHKVNEDFCRATSQQSVQMAARVCLRIVLPIDQKFFPATTC